MDFERGLLRHIGLASTAVGAFLCVALPAASPAQAQASDGNMFSSVTNFVSAPFGGGKPASVDDNNGVIDYRPRPALVVPPTNDLPPPQSQGARSPDWPKDPDGTALRKAKADSRRPAPSAGSAAGADAGPSQGVYVPVDGPNCNSVAGMPMCFTMPWGQEVTLPGAKKDNQGVRLTTSASRKYLTDPPVTYMEAVQLSQNEPGHAQDQGGQKATGAVAAAPAPGEKPPVKCMFPGWFGCPAQTQAVQLSQGDPASGQNSRCSAGSGSDSFRRDRSACLAASSKKLHCSRLVRLS